MASDNGDEAAVAFREFPDHPLLAMFPAPTDREIGAMAASVKDRGVQQKIRVWKSHKGEWLLIDGRTRQAGSKRAFDEMVASGEAAGGAPVANNGLPIQPEFEPFDGSLEDVLQFMKDTHTRKHYSPAQRAAMGVGLHYYEYKRSHHGKLPSVEKEMQEEGAASAADLAVRYDCNVYYIVICRQLYREAPDLFDAVALNVIAPAKAAAQLKERRAGNSPDAPGDEDAAAAERAAKDDGADSGEEILVDDEGTAIPEKCQDEFKSRAAFQVIRKEIRQARVQAERLATLPGGSGIDFETLDKQFGVLLAHLHNAAPYLVCAACSGTKKRHSRDCKRCGATGFVTRALVKAEKKAAEAEERAKEKDAAPVG